MLYMLYTCFISLVDVSSFQSSHLSVSVNAEVGPASQSAVGAPRPAASLEPQTVDKIDNLEKKLLGLTDKVDRLISAMPPQRHSGTAASDVASDQKLLVRAARNVQTLLRTCDHLVRVPAQDLVYCSACTSGVPTSADHRATGVFRCTAEAARDFRPGTSLPQEFRNMKASIGHHIATASHA